MALNVIRKESPGNVSDTMFEDKGVYPSKVSILNDNTLRYINTSIFKCTCSQSHKHTDLLPNIYKSYVAVLLGVFCSLKLFRINFGAYFLTNTVNTFTIFNMLI